VVVWNVTDLGETVEVVDDGNVQTELLPHGATWPEYSVGLVIFSSLISLLVAVPPPGPVPPGFVIRLEPTMVVCVIGPPRPAGGVAVSVTRR
jgi:hypothetical protein